MKRLRFLFVALPLAASACSKPADPLTSRSNPPSSLPAALASPSIWRFEFRNLTSGDPDAVVPVPSTVWVKIVKYDPEAGEVEWSKIHREGQPLGFNREGSAVHSVFSKKKGRMVSVDFNCGGRIEKIQVDKQVECEYQVCSPKDGPQGPVCDGPVKVKRRHRVNEVAYTIENSRRQSSQWALGSEPRSDWLCPAHGGPAVPETPTPEELHARRVDEAAELLDEADSLWISDKPSDKRKAQGIYRKLAESFADTDAVKPRKSEISDRARKKLE